MTLMTAIPSTREVFSASGTLLARPAENNTVEILDAATGRLLTTYYGHQEGLHHLTHHMITHIEWQEDEESILTTSTSGATHCWNVRSGTHLHTLAQAAILRGHK